MGYVRIAGTAVVVVGLVAACGSAPKKPSDFHPTADQRANFLSIEHDAGGFLGKHASDDDLVGFGTDACSFMSHESYAKTKATIEGDFTKFHLSYKPEDVQTLVYSAVKQLCPAYEKKLPPPS